MTPEYLKLKLQINRKIKTIAKHQSILQDLKDQCPHEELEVKSSYFGGSYYDTAYTDTWNQCKLCGKRSEIATERHGWYG